MGKRPNFLLFITDQHRADHLGCYGNEVVRTPAIDGIAARGWRFDRFYVASPICMANRATLMTGRMPSINGVRSNGYPLSLDATTFPDLLQSAGYRTALIGKAHLQSMTGFPPVLKRAYQREDTVRPPDALDEATRHPYAPGRYDQEALDAWRADPDHKADLPFYGFEHADFVTMHGDEAHGDYARWLEAQHPGSDSLRGAENQLPGNTYKLPQAWRTAVPEELYSTTYIADQTVDYLTQQAGSDAPFFIQCGFPDPHHPFTPPGKYWDMYNPADMKLPAAFADPDNNAPPTVHHLAKIRADGSGDVNGTNPFFVDEQETREALALTYGMTTMVDDAIARVMNTLEQTGLADDTVVIFTADHGDFLGDHRLMLKGPIHYQGLIRVPFIWSDPKEDTAGAHDGMCGTLDIAQTILDHAGVEPFNGIQGESLRPAMQDGADDVHDAMLVEEENQRTFLGFDAPPRLRTVVTRTARLSIYDGVEWGELYDLDQDPTEMRNLWDDPAAAALKADMMEMLARTMTGLVDTSPLPTCRA